MGIMTKEEADATLLQRRYPNSTFLLRRNEKGEYELLLIMLVNIIFTDL